MHPLHLLLPLFACGLALFATPARAQSLTDLPEHTLRRGLPHTAARLAANRELRVAYLGGSITQADGYRPLTTAWLRSQFPNAAITEINSAVPGTGSTLGVFRLRREVLSHHPNLLFVEFAVNDNGVPAQRVTRAMEGIVRQTLAADPTTDIIFVYTLMESYVPILQRGGLPPSMQTMERVADHYGIPTVLMAKPATAEIADNRMLIRAPKPEGERSEPSGSPIPAFSPDGTHPFKTTGHRLYAESLQRFFTAALAIPATTAAPSIPTPLDPHNDEHAQLLPLATATLTGDWPELPRDHEAWREYLAKLPEIRVARTPADTLTLRFTVPPNTLGLIGAADLTGPDSGHLLVSIDGAPPRLVERFNSFSHRYKRRFVVFAENLAPGDHTITLHPADTPIDKAAILKSNYDPTQPTRYAGAAWYATDLMLIGTLLPN